MSDKPIKNALYYHQHPKPGKIEVTPTKALSNQTDLALAYSPGVAEPCLEIAKDPSSAALYTAQPSGGNYQWYCRPWLRGYRPTGLKTSYGRQRRPV